jgi:superoxide dismutase, Fe-Mn family
VLENPTEPNQSINRLFEKDIHLQSYSRSIMASKKIIIDSTLRAVAHVRSSTMPKEVIKSASAFLSSAPSGGKHTLPDLPYDYNAIEPVVSAETMTIHHSKHHNAYVTNLNIALEKLDAAVSSGDVAGIIGLEGALRFNGGGHLNHTLFWENLCAKKDSELKDGPLKKMIDNQYGSLDGLKKELSAMSVGVQGSGWGWLGYNTKSGRIECATRANQDPLQPTTGLVPLLGIDVWEHAYYVDYRNVRPEYVSAIWDVINWDVVEKRLIDAQK